MTRLEALQIKIFADGADLAGIAELGRNPLIKGFTTNPTLMRKVGVSDYKAFAHDALPIAAGRSISFEVFSDEWDEMERQALEIASWGENIFVKIPVTNTRGDFAGPLIARLSAAGVQLNITAMMTPRQIEQVVACLSPGPSCYLSVFAGRVADTGRDPLPLMRECLEIMKTHPGSELIWASPRELLNIFQADAIGCHIITVTHDLLAKLALVDKDLDAYSLETVQMFHRDAEHAGYQIEYTSDTAKEQI